MRSWRSKNWQELNKSAPPPKKKKKSSETKMIKHCFQQADMKYPQQLLLAIILECLIFFFFFTNILQGQCAHPWLLLLRIAHLLLRALHCSLLKHTPKSSCLLLFSANDHLPHMTHNSNYSPDLKIQTCMDAYSLTSTHFPEERT